MAEASVTHADGGLWSFWDHHVMAMKPCSERDCVEYAIPRCSRCRECHAAHEAKRRADPGLTGRRGTTPRWRRIRLEVIARDRGCCVECGSRLELQVHHRDNDALNDDLANLLTLCRYCHRLAHNLPRTPSA
jgi:5-methylcytosine-specific restriction endonuclease McrA